MKVRTNAWLDKERFYDPKLIDVDILNINICYDQQILYRIHHKGFKIELFCYFRRESEKIVVCGQDAVQRHLVSLPYFYRWSWYADINCSFISLNDPTLYMNDALNGGWHQGYRDAWALEAVAEVLRMIFVLLEMDSRKAILYGISAGGFWALMTSTCFPSCTVIVEIPQVDLFTYSDEGPKDRMMKRCYKGRSIDYVRQKYASRMRVIDRWTESSTLPSRVWYYQNIKDRSHMRTQMEPFWDDVQKLQSCGSLQIDDISFRFFNRRTQKGGHVPMEKDDTLNVWREALHTI